MGLRNNNDISNVIYSAYNVFLTKFSALLRFRMATASILTAYMFSKHQNLH
jgi:hypothetical protein